MPHGSLQFVIVVFPDHTHLLFLLYHLQTLPGVITVNYSNTIDIDILLNIEKISRETTQINISAINYRLYKG